MFFFYKGGAGGTGFIGELSSITMPYFSFESKLCDSLCFKESPREGNSDFMNFCEVSPAFEVKGS